MDSFSEWEYQLSHNANSLDSWMESVNFDFEIELGAMLQIG